MQNALRTVLPTLFLGMVLQPTQAAPESFVSAQYGRPQQRVPVAGARRLNLVCIGSGQPAVIFLYGLGSGSYDWRKIQPSIGKVTKACTYDRAGQGFSDPADRTSDVTNAVSDLHALLLAAGLPKPVVLVGHSLGGFYATVYAETYPQDIAGMLLVEPAFPGQARAISEAVGATAANQLAAGQEQTDATLSRCISLAKSGRLSDPAEAKSECLDNPPDADPDVHQEKTRELAAAAYESALGSEYRSANIAGSSGKTLDNIESERTGASLRSMPLIVLTRGNVEKMGGLTADQQSRADAAWKAGHDRLAALSSHGTNIVVPHAGHFVQLDQPGVVIVQIKQILRALAAVPFAGPATGGDAETVRPPQ